MYDVDGNGWIDLPEMTKIGIKPNQIKSKLIKQIITSANQTK